MKLPPLPLTDGCLFVDNSFLSTIQECTFAAQLSKLHKRSLGKRRAAMSFGSAGHSVWDWRYKNKGNEVVDVMDEMEQIVILDKFYASEECNIDPDDFRSLPWAIELFIQRYNARYQIEPFNILTSRAGDPLVELSFAFPLIKLGNIWIIFCGKIDLVVWWEDGIWVIDHKTTKFVSDYFWGAERVSLQYPGYVTGLIETIKGIDMPKGFCVNAIRSANAPGRPRGGIDAWWEEGFQRYKEYITPEHLVRWRQSAIGITERFLFHYDKGLMPEERRSCVGKFGPCQYGDVCDLPKSQQEIMLSSDMFVDDNWSPLKPHGK